MACSWPCMASLDTPVPSKTNLPESGKSFSQILAGAPSVDNFLAKLPPMVNMEDSIRIKISQAA